MWVGADLHRHYDDAARKSEANLLVTPATLYEFRSHHCAHRIASAESRLDLVLPLARRLDDVVGNKCVDPPGSQLLS
jgi:hypothetical protein